MSYIEDTLAYYDNNAERFVADTADVEFGALQEKFARRLPDGARVLDLGCGSGRDSLFFLKSGFSVVAVDGSEAMCEAAAKLTGLEVQHKLFDEYDPSLDGPFDGIWACSSLLHVPLENLRDLLSRYAAALKLGGVFYLSFKLGTHRGMRNGRWFTDLDEQKLRELIADVPGLDIDEIDITSDVRPGRSNERWLNVWCLRN